MTDVFSVRRGVRCAGLHKLIDYEGVAEKKLSDAAYVRRALEGAAQAIRATQLYGYYHTSPGADLRVTGFLAFAEGHIAIHTWPNAEFATIDVFISGAIDLDVCLKHLKDCFQPRRQHRNLRYRGRDIQHKQGDLFVDLKQKNAAS